MLRKGIGVPGFIADYTIGTAIVLARLLLQDRELQKHYQYRLR